MIAPDRDARPDPARLHAAGHDAAPPRGRGVPRSRPTSSARPTARSRRPTGQLTTSTTGGTVAPGTYYVEITYATAGGESSPSAAQAVTASSTTSDGRGSGGSGGSGGGGGSGGSGSRRRRPRRSRSPRLRRPPGRRDGTSTSRSRAAPLRPPAGPIPIGTSLTLTRPRSPAARRRRLRCSSAHITRRSNCRRHRGRIRSAAMDRRHTLATSRSAALGPDDTRQAPATRRRHPARGPAQPAHIASIVNPGLNGWFALNGSEINDNVSAEQRRCVHPASWGLRRSRGDTVTVGNSSQNPYLLQREFNNAGVIESDPTTYFGCAPQRAVSRRTSSCRAPSTKATRSGSMARRQRPH